MFCSTSQFVQPSVDFVMAALGVTKRPVIEKTGLHHLPVCESHFCTLRNIRTGLVTIYCKNYKQSLRL